MAIGANTNNCQNILTPYQGLEKTKAPRIGVANGAFRGGLF